MKPASRLALLTLGISLTASAQMALRGPDAPQTIVRMSVDFKDGGGDSESGTVTVKIEHPWHINSNKPLEEFFIPTVLRIESTVLSLKGVEYPPYVERTFAFAPGSKLAVYEGTIRIPFAGTRLAPSGTARIVLDYQACNDKVCLPPRSASIEVEYPSGKVISGDALSPGEPGPPPGPTHPTRFTPLSDAPPSGGLFSSDVAGTLASRGWGLTLLAIFVLGLALNLTPCVYPLIPITIGFFSSQSAGKRSQRIGLSVFYVLGIAITYSALGVFSALSGKLFGAWLQLPAVLIFFALLMIVLAASMFGLFEIKVPHFLADRAGARGGLLGALTMGLLVGIVAAPCVGPFVISLIALVSQMGSPLIGFVMFFVLALGLGLPYLLLGIFSSGLSAIPRSGMWMVQIKKAMGFILIAMAVYFLRPLIGEEIYRWGVGLSLIIGGAWLLFVGRNAGAKAIRYVTAALLLIVGLWFVRPQDEKGGVVWMPYSEAAISAAQAKGQPVMIDFYADWCLPCKELDAKTFSRPAVIAESQRFVRLKADLTRANDERVQELTSRYAVLGVPTILFLDRRGQEQKPARLTGFEEPAPFLERMKSVR